MRAGGRWSAQLASMYRGSVQDSDALVSKELSTSVFVPSGKDVLQVDLEKRSVKRVFETPVSIDSLAVTGPTHSYSGDTWYRGIHYEVVLVRANNVIYTLNSKLNLTREFTLPREDAIADMCYELEGGKTLMSLTLPAQRHGPIPHLLIWIAADGSIE